MSAQDAQAVSSMVETALEEFETSNGPVVQLASRLRCSEDGREERDFCPEPWAETLLAEYASERGATLVGELSGLPPCRWNEGETDQAKGAWMSLHLHRGAEGGAWVSVTVMCERDPDHYLGGVFLEGTRYPFRQVDGVWQRSGEAITIIT